ncbi:MAG TPA: alpha/beta hydrolase [Caldimonas sp.]|nr:alpha/beta hydrolase [Caldimonas sp.]
MTSASLYRGFTRTEEIDAEYKPSSRVADAEALMRSYGERSAAARTRLAGRIGIPYGPTLDEKLDIFPADRPGAPVFVFIHGGYWRAFSAGEHSFVALGPVALGITTVVVDYSLCPKVTLDEITRQCRAAVAWTLRHIGAHGGDPTRVAVGGHSAGGHLSAMCLEARWDEDYGLARDPLAAALLVSGIYDIEPLRHSYLQPTIQLDDGIVRRNSPLFGVRPCATPVLLTWGAEESDEFARQSTAFDAAWRSAGNRSELLAQPGANHFTAIDGFADPAHPLCRWLAARLLTSP